ncbi:MAG: FAD-binding oxidoreductase, partial [Acidobacteria bacterium]|nr:FAD-binding oxidoreductase [Acidobacteriota bacterium]
MEISSAAAVPHVTPEAVAQRLAEAFGADRVKQPHGNAFRLGEEETRVIAYPHNIEELSAMMKLAHEANWRVAPAGAGTWLEMGNAIAQFHLIVSTAQMNRVLEYEPADLTCSVEAGVTLREFNLQAAEHNQFLPLDPFGDEKATIGATVATASYGPLRAGYGTPRDWLVGCRVVHADGTITTAGGKVVKNVAGYDLCKLYTGSFGTLVILAELYFKMRALPRADATQVFYADDAATLCS